MKPTTILSLSLLIIYSSLVNCENVYSKSPSNNSVDSNADSLYTESVREYIRTYSDRIGKSTSTKLDGNKITGNDVIVKLYREVNYELVWDLDSNRKDLISILEDSYYDGLNPKDYHIDFIKEYDIELEGENQLECKRVALADIIMTDALLTYSFHMIQGKVNPTQLDPNWNYSQRPLPDSAELRIWYRLQTQSLKEGVNNIRSELPMYRKLRYWFAKYDSVQKSGGEINQIQYPGTPLRLGDSLEVIGELKRHLSMHSNTLSYDEDYMFDTVLETSLKEFQKHNGLDNDGVAGKKTFEALNMTIAERMDILRINMERCRWLNNDIPEEFLLVNIADFHLYIFRSRIMDYSSRVVVGKEHHETPVFTSDIKYVVFNPTWTVPYSIASKELLPKLKQDRNYLNNKNMTLIRGGKTVDPSTVDFSQYSEKNFPFTIRQEPGSNNALGRMKFIFPNHHAVYLHDTPSKAYFNKSERAFSHGCVRVQNPEILAEQLLGNKGYNQKKIKDVLDSEKTQNVYLKTPMTVMLMYWTCYEFAEDGKMYFYRDIYGRDPKILNELKENR